MAHIDMDCFYVQVERSLDQSLTGLPTVVIQYNPFGDLKTVRSDENRRGFQNGSAIAVSYEARRQGVKRGMRGADMVALCPDLEMVTVPTAHGKADLTIYRDAGNRVVEAIKRKVPQCLIEKASIDEVYLDVTEEVHSRLGAEDLNFGTDVIPRIRQTWLAGQDAKEASMSKLAIRAGYAGTMTAANVSGNKAAKDVVCEESTITYAWMERHPMVWPMEDRLLAVGAMIISEIREVLALLCPQSAHVTHSHFPFYKSLMVHNFSSSEYFVSHLDFNPVKDIKNTLGFTCSGGIAHNKLLAKLASSMHKPNKQTMVPLSAVSGLMSSLSLTRLKGFGGELGRILMEKMKANTVSDLLSISEGVLSAEFGDQTAQWMINAAKGLHHDPVVDRMLPKQIGCSKTFRGANTLSHRSLLEGIHGEAYKWIRELSGELLERVEQDTIDNGRIPRKLSASATIVQKSPGSPLKGYEPKSIPLSKQCSMPTGSADTVASIAANLVKKAITSSSKFNATLDTYITVLGLSAFHFDDDASKTVRPISSFFGSPSSLGSKEGKDTIFSLSKTPPTKLNTTDITMNTMQDVIRMDHTQMMTNQPQKNDSRSKSSGMVKSIGGELFTSRSPKPMPPSEITPYLYMGCKADAESLHKLTSLGITHILARKFIILHLLHP